MFLSIMLMCQSVFVESFSADQSALPSRPFLSFVGSIQRCKVRQEAFENAMGDLDSLDAEQHPLQQDIP